MYNERIMELFKNPKNEGEIENPDGLIKLRNLICGDEIGFSMKVENGIIKDIRFRTFGCAASIAASSIITEMVLDKTLEQVTRIEKKDIIDELGGLPSIKMYCIELVFEAFHSMIENYMKGKYESELAAS